MVLNLKKCDTNIEKQKHIQHLTCCAGWIRVKESFKCVIKSQLRVTTVTQDLWSFASTSKFIGLIIFKPNVN